MKTTILELLQSSDMSSAAVTAVERKAKPAEPATCTVEAFEKLVAQHGLAGSFHIPNAVREELQSQLGLDSTRMLHLCMKMVQPRAVAPVSNFHVGAAALGETGDVHMGVNLEFKNNPLTNICTRSSFSC
jgi:cytidine deaminase